MAGHSLNNDAGIGDYTNNDNVNSHKIMYQFVGSVFREGQSFKRQI